MKQVFLCLAILLAACANPRYAPAGADELTKQGSGLPCQARMELGGQCLSLTWETMPSEEGFGSFQLRVFPYEQPDRLEDLPDLYVLLWMPSMGHGSSPVSLSRLGPGTYRISNVYFSMRGEWEIRFQVKAGSLVQDEAIYSFRF